MEVSIFYIGQKLNSKGAKQKLLIFCTNQKISTWEEEYPASKAHKVQKVTIKYLSLSITSINNTENKLEGHIPYVNLKLIDIIKKQRE